MAGDSARSVPATCPTCNSVNDAVTCLTDPGAAPRPGDFAVCFYCASILRYGADLSLAYVPEGEPVPEALQRLQILVFRHRSSARH